jgi:tRNA-dihydrouridine synthase A
MMDRTDRHYRYLMRQITRCTLLYTEMLTCHAIIHGDRSYLLDYDASEHPLALQLGGDDPKLLAQCALIGEDWGYDEINLNVGCPSERVQNGHFGAALMAHPEKVAECVATMRNAVSIPVTVKHRIGIDEIDRYEDMARFVEIVSPSGCDRFTVHARKAWLQGLSPKENRTVPPLRYEDVHRLKEDFPNLVIEINGGFQTLQVAHAQLNVLDAVMVGRAAYDNPFIFASADEVFFGQPSLALDRHEVMEAMVVYAEKWLHQGGYLRHISRHCLNLFKGQPRARSFRRILTEKGCRDDASADVFIEALSQVPKGSLPQPQAMAT